MKPERYKISLRAGQDLRKIWKYTFKKWSEEHADRYYNLIIQEIEFLAKNPENGKPISNIREGYRKSKVKSHFIFYRINSVNKIEVIRVLHQMMDIPNRLKQ